MNNESIIRDFYTAFQKGDWQKMQACYHDQATFSDPVFPHLTGTEPKAMWHMLLSSSKDLKITFQDIHAEGNKGTCHWEAIYTFSKTGRKVHNKIDATFEFKDGLIIRHTDRFNLWKWAGMALGTTGSLLGWTPYVRKKVQAMAQKSLKKFKSENLEYQ